MKTLEKILHGAANCMTFGIGLYHGYAGFEFDPQSPGLEYNSINELFPLLPAMISDSIIMHKIAKKRNPDDALIPIFESAFAGISGSAIAYYLGKSIGSALRITTESMYFNYYANSFADALYWTHSNQIITQTIDIAKIIS